MAQTPLSASTPYCTAARLVQLYDAELVQDLLRTGDNPRPSYLCVLDSTSTEGAKLLRHLLAASGELESACLTGNRYTPSDLQALTGAGLAKAEKIVAALCLLSLAEGRQPNSAGKDNVPGAARALHDLEMLRSGERIFSLTESGNAGLPGTTTPEQSQVLNGNGAVYRAPRLFGTHGRGY